MSTKRYNSVDSLVIELQHDEEDCSDITGAQLRMAYNEKLASLSDDMLMQLADFSDTFDVWEDTDDIAYELSLNCNTCHADWVVVSRDEDFDTCPDCKATCWIVETVEVQASAQTDPDRRLVRKDSGKS